jgi:hypothetical protein
MDDGIAAGSGRPPIPFLSLADVFICAVSIVFIMLLLADPRQVLVLHPPQADVRLRCEGDGVRLIDTRSPGAAAAVAGVLRPDSEAMRALLAGLEVGDALSVRVLIEAPVAEMPCARTLVRVIEALNEGLSDRLLRGEAGAYLLDDIEVLDAMPESEAAAASPRGT